MKAMKIILTLIFAGGFVACAFLTLGPSCEVQKEVLARGDFEVNISKYQQTGTEKKTLILIPPTGGTNYIDRRYAEKFCKKGYAVTILNSWSGQDEVSYELELHQRFYSGAQRAITAVIEEIRKGGPDRQIGVLGTSVGALHAMVAASLQKEVSAVFSIVGGASIAEVVATSDQKAMQTLREERKKLYGIQTTEQHIKAINGALHLDPFAANSTLGDQHQNKKLGLAIADQDTTVTTATQKELEKRWQPQVVIQISGGHFWGIVKTWLFHVDEVVKFFEDAFASKP